MTLAVKCKTILLVFPREHINVEKVDFRMRYVPKLGNAIQELVFLRNRIISVSLLEINELCRVQG